MLEAATEYIAYHSRSTLYVRC